MLVLDTCVVRLAGLVVNEDPKPGQELPHWLSIELALIPVLMPVHASVLMIYPTMIMRLELAFSMSDFPSHKQVIITDILAHIRPAVRAAVLIIPLDNRPHRLPSSHWSRPSQDPPSPQGELPMPAKNAENRMPPFLVPFQGVEVLLLAVSISKVIDAFFHSSVDRDC